MKKVTTNKNLENRMAKFITEHLDDSSVNIWELNTIMSKKTSNKIKELYLERIKQSMKIRCDKKSGKIIITHNL